MNRVGLEVYPKSCVYTCMYMILYTIETGIELIPGIYTCMYVGTATGLLAVPRQMTCMNPARIVWADKVGHYLLLHTVCTYVICG